MTLVSTFVDLVQQISWVMTQPTFHSFLIVVTGWVFARRRTVTNMIVADHCHAWIHEVWKNDRLYHACSKCTAKWFSRSESTQCPRCGSDQVSVTQEFPPWAAQG